MLLSAIEYKIIHIFDVIEWDLRENCACVECNVFVCEWNWVNIEWSVAIIKFEKKIIQTISKQTTLINYTPLFSKTVNWLFLRTNQQVYSPCSQKGPIDGFCEQLYKSTWYVLKNNKFVVFVNKIGQAKKNLLSKKIFAKQKKRIVEFYFCLAKKAKKIVICLAKKKSRAKVDAKKVKHFAKQNVRQTPSVAYQIWLCLINMTQMW